MLSAPSSRPRLALTPQSAASDSRDQTPAQSLWVTRARSAAEFVLEWAVPGFHQLSRRAGAGQLGAHRPLTGAVRWILEGIGSGVRHRRGQHNVIDLSGF